MRGERGRAQALRSSLRLLDGAGYYTLRRSLVNGFHVFYQV